jgi:hypothetical protein
MMYSKNEIYNDQTHKSGFFAGVPAKTGENWGFFQHQPHVASTKIPSAQFPEFLCGNFRLGFRLPPLLPSGKLT